MHEFIHELCHLIVRNALLAKPQIEVILQELFVIRSEIQADGKSRGGTYPVSRLSRNGDKVDPHSPSAGNIK